jgi:hypothetical protein
MVYRPFELLNDINHGLSTMVHGPKNMYIIKVKGVAKIPDYVQLRDDKFTLLAYFRVDRPDKSLDKVGLHDKTEYIMNIIKDLPFGQILKLEL